MYITRPQLKKFIKQNEGQLFIRNDSSFSGMSDMCEDSGDRTFYQATKTDRDLAYTHGINGVYVIPTSGANLMEEFDNGVFKGISVYNCCGSFVIAVRK